jgi:hypothetical protein
MQQTKHFFGDTDCCSSCGKAARYHIKINRTDEFLLRYYRLTLCDSLSFIVVSACRSCLVHAVGKDDARLISKETLELYKLMES